MIYLLIVALFVFFVRNLYLSYKVNKIQKTTMDLYVVYLSLDGIVKLHGKCLEAFAKENDESHKDLSLFKEQVADGFTVIADHLRVSEEFEDSDEGAPKKKTSVN